MGKFKPLFAALVSKNGDVEKIDESFDKTISALSNMSFSEIIQIAMVQ